jgi:hypothetical protein
MRGRTRWRRAAWALGLTALFGCSDSAWRAVDQRASAGAAALGWLPAPGTIIARSNSAATLLPSGQVLITGGMRHGTAETERSAELYDPATGSSRMAGSMTEGRWSHAATLLHDGRVLVVGGFTNLGTGSFAGAEIYDPVTDAFHPIPQASSAFSGLTATVLGSGRVLLVGQGSAQIFDPTTDAFHPVAHPSLTSHTATLLRSGKVLITGGALVSEMSLAEEFDPESESFAPVGSMAYPRAFHSATLLPSGDVLVVGGVLVAPSGAPAEIYHPDQHTFSSAGLTVRPRRGHAALLLPSGKVLIVGGTLDASPPAEAELFDPVSGAFTSLPHPADTCWTVPQATLLVSGQALLAGGCADPSEEIFDPERDGDSAAFQPLGAPSIQRAHHTATLLLSGKVLLAGGEDGGAAQSSAFLFDPAGGGALSKLPPMTTPRTLHAAALLPSGKVVLAGGHDADGAALGSMELFDPEKGSFSPAAEMVIARDSLTATLLPSGKVVLAGGFGAAHEALASAELFDPRSGEAGEVHLTGSLHTPRGLHAATPLLSGEVLVVGGVMAAADPEIFDPRAHGGAGAFRRLSSSPPPGFRIGGASATLLPSGKVLVVGLGPAGSRMVDLFDPEGDGGAGQFRRLVSMVHARNDHTATLLPSGKVLVAGGFKAPTVPPDPTPLELLTELYDPLAFPGVGKFFATTQTIGERSGHTATLLPSGKVLIAGGGSKDIPFAGIWSDGAVGDDAWRASVSEVSGLPSSGGEGAIQGIGLLGLSEATGSGRTSASNVPLLRWMPAAGGSTTGSLLRWSDRDATWIVPRTALVGPGLLFAVTNGIPSNGLGIGVGSGLGTPCSEVDACVRGVCVDGICCDTPCSDCAFACTAAKKGAGLDGDCGPITLPGEGCCTSNLDCAGSDVCDVDGKCRRPPEPGVAGGCNGAGSPPGPWLVPLALLLAVAAARRPSARRSGNERWHQPPRAR